MKLGTSVNTVTDTLFKIYIASSVRGTNPITVHNSYTWLDLPSTTSGSYETIFLAKYKLEDVGVLTVQFIGVTVYTRAKGDGQIKWEMSGDGGNTWTSFIELTFNYAAFTTITRIGEGEWVNTVNTGNDQLQIRLQALANSGTVDLKLRDSSIVFIEYKQSTMS